MFNEKSVLPVDFDGVFRFTNFSDREFKAKWGGVEYTFPALKSTPMIIPTLSPLEIQNVRKKFAKELAEREFYESKDMKKLEKMNTREVGSLHSSVTYNPRDLEQYIEKCLSPLPVGQIGVEAVIKTDIEDVLHKDKKGNPITKVIDQDESLIGNGQVINS